MPSAKYEIKRKCEVCGSMFLAKTLDSHYCCRKCSDIAYNRRRAEATKRQQMDKVISLMPEGRDYISVAEAEAIFGVCKETIRRMIRRGKVSSINLGTRLTRVSKSELMGILPLREEPANRDVALPRPYNLEPEDCYTIGEFLGLSPHHPTRAAAVANIFMSTPVSAIMAVAARSLTPGMV